MSEKIKNGNSADRFVPSQGVSPSAFMRKLRPGQYSDTSEQAEYSLAQTTLEYHLESITSRNQMQDFEIFCRKLCERTICPNLLPPTGPEGGGDSKADTESYPVADEIFGLTYVGSANAGREKWAFAISAMTKWYEKVRKDVKGIIETRRGYSRIFFVTSRFARARDRARIEDELTLKYGTPVTILDRSWIVKEIIENDRADLAYNYLKIGEVRNSPRLGPNDYSRSQQLADLERAIENPAAFRGMEHQLATEALLAAELSRNLERPRIETDGRFERAIRLADKHGSFRQKLEARYERVWTTFWWFDDYDFVNSSYDDFEARALVSVRTKDLEFLANLHQLLVNSVIDGRLTNEECQFDERSNRLRQALEKISQNAEMPNNSLEAVAALLRLKVNHALKTRDAECLPDIWQGYIDVLEKADGLAEFDADTLARCIEVFAEIAGNDPKYNELIEKLAEFIGNRKSEGEGAVILLRRAQKLDFSDRFDMIRILGKATVGLTKREYSEQLIEAVRLLSLAYRSAGLLWASRACCVLAVGSIVIDGEKDSTLPASIVPTMQLWAWSALELGHVPDFLFAIQLLNNLLESLPLSEDSKKRAYEANSELDAIFGCRLLNLEDVALQRLDELPDILNASGLEVARIALLYYLGYEDKLRGEGSLPREQSGESVMQTLTALKNQPAAQSFSGSLVLNCQGHQTYATKILGMTVEVQIDETESIPIAEAVLGSIDAFFATIIEKHVAPHVELFRIVVTQSETTREPTIETNDLDMVSRINWPRGHPVNQLNKQSETRTFLTVVAGNVLAAACAPQNFNELLDGLYKDEAVGQRIAMIVASSNSYSRVTSRRFSCLHDWHKVVRESYCLRDQRPELMKSTVITSEVEAGADADAPKRLVDNYDHRRMSVRSVINVHAWNRAKWVGCGLVGHGGSRPPWFALLYKDGTEARKIFEQWRDRFGEEDLDDEISISVIRRLPKTNAHHYRVQISSNLRALDVGNETQPISMPAKSCLVEPGDSQPLDMFIENYRRVGAYYLLPATLNSAGKATPSFFDDLAIKKSTLNVKLADDISEHDIEAISLRMHEPNFAQ